MLNNEVDNHATYFPDKPCSTCTSEVDYCDPTWLSYPNLNAALVGLDLPSLNPMPDDWVHEPGVRHQIFQAVEKEAYGNMAQYDYLVTVDNLRCTSSFEQYLFSTFDEAVDHWSKFISSGYNLQVGNEVKVAAGKGGFKIGTTIPPLFTRGSSKSKDASGMKKHFESEGGSVAHTRAECSIYMVKVKKQYLFAKEIDMALKLNNILNVK